MFTNRFVIVTKNVEGSEMFDADKGRDAVLTFKETASMGKSLTRLIDTVTGEVIAAGNKFTQLDKVVNEALAKVA